MGFFVGSVVKTEIGADVKYQGRYITSEELMWNIKVDISHQTCLKFNHKIN